MILLKIARDLLWAIGDGLDMAIEQLSPIDHRVTIHKSYGDIDA